MQPDIYSPSLKIFYKFLRRSSCLAICNHFSKEGIITVRRWGDRGAGCDCPMGLFVKTCSLAICHSSANIEHYPAATKGSKPFIARWQQTHLGYKYMKEIWEINRGLCDISLSFLGIFLWVEFDIQCCHLLEKMGNWFGNRKDEWHICEILRNA